MFDFANANEGQKQAISTVDCPVLITAGPGTGKTYTLVQRTLYLIQERGVQPEQILVATFTEKAAKELITRITNELAARGIVVNINEMYVGTFHSLCLRIIKEHLEYSRLKKNYRVLDDFDQVYTVFQNFHKFKNISDIDSVLTQQGQWRRAEEICQLVNNLSEELVSADTLKQDNDLRIAVLGELLKKYQELLSEHNLLDFAAIQAEAYRLLKETPAVLAKILEKIHYVMIDEYQDTNYIQEQIVFLLGGAKNNICVVGDDDQGLYRFRGATIRNILEFPNKFSKGECQRVQLDVNYRSDSGIIDFYNNWMETTDGARFRFSWGKFRYPKEIKPFEESKLKSPAVVKIATVEDENEWHERIYSFIAELKKTGKLTDYNQVAFLFNSVKHKRVIDLAQYLEDHGINVYSPRSDMFFQRDEVKLALGCLMLMFPAYVQGLQNQTHEFINDELRAYYTGCIQFANSVLTQPEHKDLLKFVRRRGKIHSTLTNTTDYAYSGLMYQMFEHEPFHGVLSFDVKSGIIDIRPTRNIAILTQIIGKFDYLQGIEILTAEKIEKNTNWLFNFYLSHLFQDGIGEYEDDSEYAPSGCVSFLTIHQSKGMEFPLVFVDSLHHIPKNHGNALLQEVGNKHFHRQPFEPSDQMKFFDFWRLYYTAFSRAQNLLILTYSEKSGRHPVPSKYFEEIASDLSDINDGTFDASEFTFKTVKDVNLKETFSFTSHISVYETCALQYKFYKEFEFEPVRVNAMLFGMLVHQTIEDMHRAALRKEEHLIIEPNIGEWFDNNYAALSKSEHAYLSQPQREAALKHVLRYFSRQNGHWDVIQHAEVDVSLVKPDYILKGTIDLIRGEGNTVELVDFKSQKKPDLQRETAILEHYRRQLHIYAHLVEERIGRKVSKMHIYYTGEEEGSVPTVTWEYDKKAVVGTVEKVDETVQKILRKEYGHTCTDTKYCNNCDFKHYCKKI